MLDDSIAVATPQRISFASLEAQKENVRPTRAGRKIEHITREPDTQEFKAEKYKLEANIKIASEPNDLIDAYYDLIQFYEQHSLSKTTNQRDLLKQFCLNKTIRSDETAKQNKKYIDSWIKVMRDFCHFDRTKGLLSCMKSEKIGTNDVDYYIFAGDFYTEHNDFANAEKIFNEGLYKKLPGNNKLLASFHKYQAKKENFDKNPELYQENIVKNKGLQVRKNSTQQSTGLSIRKPTKTNSTLQVFEGEECENMSKGGYHGDAPFSNKENEQQRQKWTNGPLKSSGLTSGPTQDIHIEVFEDEDSIGQTPSIRKINSKREKILCKSSKKNKEFVLDTDSGLLKTKYMYQKSRCEAGIEIFSIEELRALHPKQILKTQQRIYEKKMAEDKLKNEQALAKQEAELAAALKEVEKMKREMETLTLENKKKDKEISELNTVLVSLNEQRENADSEEQRLLIEAEIEQTIANFNGSLDTETMAKLEAKIPWKNQGVKMPTQLAVSGLGDDSVETKMYDGDGNDSELEFSESYLNKLENTGAVDMCNRPSSQDQKEFDIFLDDEGDGIKKNEFEIFCDDEVMTKPPAQSFEIFYDEETKIASKTCSTTEKITFPSKQSEFSIFCDEETRPSSQVDRTQQKNCENTGTNLKKALFTVSKKPNVIGKRKALGELKHEKASHDSTLGIVDLDDMTDYRMESTSFQPSSNFREKRETIDFSPISSQSVFTPKEKPKARKSIWADPSSCEPDSGDQTEIKVTKIENPWDDSIISKWLETVKPLENYKNYKKIPGEISTSKFRKNAVVEIDGMKFKVVKKCGEGNFARVYWNFVKHLTVLFSGNSRQLKT